MTGLRTRYLPLVVIVLLGIALSFAIRNSTGRINPLFGDSDHAVLIALQMQMNDASLYSSDTELNAMAQGYPKPMNWIMAQLLQIFPVAQAYLIASIVLYVVFLTGIYVLALYLTGNVLFSSIVAMLNLYGQKGLHGIGWGIQLGQVLPRDVFIALFPWVILGVFVWQSDWKRLTSLFFAIGLLANIHFLSAFYIFCILAIYCIASDPRTLSKHVRFLIPGTMAFFLGALPYVLMYMLQPHPLIQQLVEYRMPYIYQLLSIENVLYLLLPVTAAYLGYRHGNNTLPSQHARSMGLLFVSTTIFIAMGFVLSQFSVKFAVLQFFRASSYMYLPMLFFAAALIYRQWSRNRLLAIGLAAILIIPLGMTALHFWPYQKTDTAIKTAARPADYWAEFQELSTWAHTSTSTDALFIVPPLGFDIFRITAQRGILTSYKDGATLILMVADGGQTWNETFTAVQQAYLTNDPERFNDLAMYTTPHPAFLVVESAKNPLNAMPVFRNRVYEVYVLPFA